MIVRARLLFALGIAAFAGTAAWAQLEAIPAGEERNPPSSVRLADLARLGSLEGWGPLVPVLRDAAFQAYREDRLSAAEAWFYAYRWAALFAESERDCVANWSGALREARVGHAGMTGQYKVTDRPLGLYLSPEAQAWVLANANFSEEFFSLLSPLDYMPGVLRILDELYRGDPAGFARYSSLALAIAVVHDVPPPPFWPHAQVAPEALERRWPPAREAFAWWVRQDTEGRTYQRLTRLRADELKFVVDAAASFPDLSWSQEIVNYPLGQFERTYSMICYRRDREANGTAIWSDRAYTLPAILGAGGICIDQAYFAAEAGKARGIPTLLFYGEGQDGRHAWFGFLGQDRRWRLDAGRYAEQRLVTGRARDPQTWTEISDHELQFLSERFRALPSFRQSRVHAEFAGDFLQAGDADAARRAARNAVNYERRNLRAWEILLDANRRAGAGAASEEALLREAALAFRRYPDLEIGFVNRMCASLRARGQTSAADFEERGLAARLHGDRSDLSTQQARNILLRSMASQPLEGQIRDFNSLVDSLGAGAGTGFFDQIVVVFVEHLAQQGARTEAVRAADRARDTLKIAEGSQLDQEMNALVARVQGTP